MSSLGLKIPRKYFRSFKFSSANDFLDIFLLDDSLMIIACNSYAIYIYQQINRLTRYDSRMLGELLQKKVGLGPITAEYKIKIENLKMGCLNLPFS